MTGRVLVSVESGGRYAPCAYLFRIVNERHHRAAMAQVAAMGGPVPSDEYGRDDNVLLDDLTDMGVPRRYWRDLDEGWTVRFLMDRWEAFSMYGYDAGDTLG